MVISESGYLQINHANIHYEMSGSGTPLVLIHAGVADSRQWNNEIENFSQDFRVLRYDLRGYGRSSPVEGEFSHMGDLVSLLDQLDFREDLILIGCSMGGTLAMDFALAHPARVKALVMVGSGPSGLSLDVPDHPKMGEAEEAYNAGNLEQVAELEAQIWFDGMGRSPEQVNQKMRESMIEMNRLALVHDASGLGERLPDARIPASEQLGKLEIPLLIIVGEFDIPYLQVAARTMLASLPSARKVVIQDAAHLPNMDHPAEFQDIVRKFIDENSPS